MTKNDVTRKIVDCIVRAGCDGCSEGDLYVDCGMNMRLWTVVRTMLVESDLMTIKSNWCELTETARGMLAECVQSAQSA